MRKIIIHATFSIFMHVWYSKTPTHRVTRVSKSDQIATPARRSGPIHISFGTLLRALHQHRTRATLRRAHGRNIHAHVGAELASLAATLSDCRSHVGNAAPTPSCLSSRCSAPTSRRVLNLPLPQLAGILGVPRRVAMESATR